MRRAATILLALAVLASACGDDAEPTPSLLLYTSVTQDTVDAVVAGYEAAHPGVTVEVFRAPTGELNARIAADLREGGLRADVLWLTDPLSMQQYDADGLLRAADPDVTGIPAEYPQRALLGHPRPQPGDRPPPRRPGDHLLGRPHRRGGSRGVAFPDPAFAGSAFAALAFFALDPDYGIEFFADAPRRRGHPGGAPRATSSPGWPRASSPPGSPSTSRRRAAADKGSPIEIVWPVPGGDRPLQPDRGDLRRPGGASDFVSYVLGVDGQTAIAATGWQPVRSDVPWAFGGPVVTLDWELAFDRQDESARCVPHHLRRLIACSAPGWPPPPGSSRSPLLVAVPLVDLVRTAFDAAGWRGGRPLRRRGDGDRPLAADLAAATAVAVVVGVGGGAARVPGTLPGCCVPGCCCRCWCRRSCRRWRGPGRSVRAASPTT